MNPKTTRYKYLGLMLIRSTAKRGGVRCGACGRRMRKGTRTACPDSVYWLSGRAVVSGHERCVRRLIRDIQSSSEVVARQMKAGEEYIRQIKQLANKEGLLT